jgi:DNA-binding transcriptional MocR family regulator
MSLPNYQDGADLARRAVERGVAVVPGEPFFPDGRGTNNVRLSFSRVEDERIEDGIERLAALVIADMEGSP